VCFQCIEQIIQAGLEDLSCLYPVYNNHYIHRENNNVLKFAYMCGTFFLCIILFKYNYAGGATDATKATDAVDAGCNVVRQPISEPEVSSIFLKHMYVIIPPPAQTAAEPTVLRCRPV
jgi:hypothetical protein